jgi:hydrogenase-4 component B
MLNLVWILIASHAIGMVLPFCLPRRLERQAVAAAVCAILASSAGIVLGFIGLTASEPVTASLPSTIPLLTFAVRLDALSAFFILTISLAGLAASIYAIGYVEHFHGRVSIAALGSLYNAFLCSMTLVVLADDALFFLILWELMSLTSYLLVVTEHEKADVRYAGLFYVIMTHVGTAFIVLTFLVFFQQGDSFSFDSFRHPDQPLSESLRTFAFFAALIGLGRRPESSRCMFGCPMPIRRLPPTCPRSCPA